MKEICDEMLNNSSSTILEVARHFLAKISGDEDGEDEGDDDDHFDDIGIDEDDRSVFDTPDDTEEVQPQRSALPVNGNSKNDWVHNTSWVGKNIEHLLAPPVDSTPGATMALQKDFKAMMKEQAHAEKNNDLATLGWYMPPEYNGENLYQWVIEMHSFDSNIPLATDMVSK
jgi:ubiquitin-conjugating enzyme E2 Q